MPSIDLDLCTAWGFSDEHGLIEAPVIRTKCIRVVVGVARDHPVVVMHLVEVNAGGAPPIACASISLVARPFQGSRADCGLGSFGVDDIHCFLHKCLHFL